MGHGTSNGTVRRSTDRRRSSAGEHGGTSRIMPDSRYEHVIIATWNLHGLLFIIPDVDTLYIQHGLLFILILPISVCILGTCSLLTGFSKKTPRAVRPSAMLWVP